MNVGMSGDELRNTFGHCVANRLEAANGDLEAASHGESPDELLKVFHSYQELARHFSPEQAAFIGGMFDTFGKYFLAILDTIEANNNTISRSLKKY